jgi:hypothetical protein
MCLVGGIDPGYRKMGFAFINTVKKKGDLYCSDLIHFSPLKKIDIKSLPQIIENYVCSFDFIFSRLLFLGIELQQISTDMVKYVARLLYESIKLNFPNVEIRIINPTRTRAFFTITVKKSEEGDGNLDKQALYKISKNRSLRVKTISKRDLRRVRTCFYSKNELLCDPFDALMLAIYFSKNSQSELNRNTAQSSKLFEREKPEMCDIIGVKRNVHGPNCAFAGNISLNM